MAKEEKTKRTEKENKVFVVDWEISFVGSVDHEWGYASVVVESLRNAGHDRFLPAQLFDVARNQRREVVKRDVTSGLLGMLH